MNLAQRLEKLELSTPGVRSIRVVIIGGAPAREGVASKNEKSGVTILGGAPMP